MCAVRQWHTYTHANLQKGGGGVNMEPQKQPWPHQKWQRAKFSSKWHSVTLTWEHRDLWRVKHSSHLCHFVLKKKTIWFTSGLKQLPFSYFPVRDKGYFHKGYIYKKKTQSFGWTNKHNSFHSNIQTQSWWMVYLDSSRLLSPCDSHVRSDTMTQQTLFFHYIITFGKTELFRHIAPQVKWSSFHFATTWFL